MSHFLRSMVLASMLSFSGVALAKQATVPELASSPVTTEPRIPASLDSDARELVESTNAFSLDLLRATSQCDQNLIVSPASVSTAVGFAYRGAAGETAHQLQQVMHYPFDPVRTLRASGAVIETMAFSAAGRDLSTANGLWLQGGMPFDETFERDMATYAKAGLHRVDFKAHPEAARQRINSWVADATRNNITELLQRGIVKGDTRAVLVNAIWFKADWLAPFREQATQKEPFTSLDGTKITQPLMHQFGDFRALRRGRVSAIQLPYKGGEVALVAFLPDNYDDLPRFEKKLTSRELEKWFVALDRIEPRETDLTLPRFKLRWGKDLADTIAQMGAPLAFSDDADFSRMTKLPYLGGDPREIGLKISHIIHEATVEINEMGSEASAATAVVMDVIVTSARRGPPPPPPFVFRADKPFLFALRDLRTGLVLFMGRYVRPEPAEDGEDTH